MMLRSSLLLLPLLLAGCATGWGPQDRQSAAPVDEPPGLGQDDDDDDSAPPDGPDGPDEDGDGHTWPLDCWDQNAQVYPGAPELCDGLDNDCSGDIDDAPDADGDGVGPCQGDCDDTDPTTSAGLAEVCDDGADNDCDAQTDEAVDADGDGARDCEDCDDTDPSTYPGAPGDGLTEPADGVDNDCDGIADPGASAPAVAGAVWVAAEIEVVTLTGVPLIDINVTNALAPLAPPLGSAIVLMLDPTAAVTAAGFSAAVGVAEQAGDGFVWPASAAPAQVACPRMGSAFTCGVVDQIDVPLGPFGALVLRDAVFAGLLDEDDALTVGSLEAVLRDGELPAITTPNGDLADVMALRSLDADTDGDGIADGWSVAFTFLPL